jgi:hypothetical protein
LFVPRRTRRRAADHDRPAKHPTCAAIAFDRFGYFSTSGIAAKVRARRLFQVFSPPFAS